MRNNSYQAAAGCRALPRPGNKYLRSQCVKQKSPRTLK